MQVECPEARHSPYHFGKHAECYHDEQICFKCTQVVYKRLVFKAHGLQQRYVVGYGIFLYRRMVHLMPASGGFVGHRHRSDDIVSGSNEGVKARHGKLGGSEEYYP